MEWGWRVEIVKKYSLPKQLCNFYHFEVWTPRIYANHMNDHDYYPTNINILKLHFL